MKTKKKLKQLTFFKCLFTHFVNVFFWMASLSSEKKKLNITLIIGQIWNSTKICDGIIRNST